MAVNSVFGSARADVARGVLLRHDHGSAFMSAHFQNQLKVCGMVPSFAFVRQPEGNGVAERLIRTLKESLLWVRTSRPSSDLYLALLDFAAWYNTRRLLTRHGHRTPTDISADQKPPIDQAA